MTTQFAICGDEIRNDDVNLENHADIKGQLQQLLSKLDFTLRTAHYGFDLRNPAV